MPYRPPGSTDKKLHVEQDDSIHEVLVRKLAHLDTASLLLNILTVGMVELPTTLEDSSDTEFALCAIVYRPMRQRLYHMIFELRSKNHFCGFQLRLQNVINNHGCITVK